MGQILIGVLSGVVTAVILGFCFYHKIESAMEQKMHKYAEALLKFQQNQGVQQTKEMAAISGKVLADEIVTDTELSINKEWNVNGEKVTISVEKI